MCAIAGMIGVIYDQKIVDSMLATMLRRGPDGNGCLKIDMCCLLHSRLAVIDIENGMQPMTVSMNGETYTIVYNGELYNTSELRNKLEQIGHSFKSHSDTEVLLHSYAEYGEKALEMLNGIYAFAVWEHNAKRLFVARDRMGVKPLFYKLHDGGFIFASEIKTILKYPTVKAELDANGVGEILLLGPGRTPGSGVFKGIHELEPGWCGQYIDGKWKMKQYWKLTDREHRMSFDETAEHLRYLVTDSIRRQMISDVPIGSFLSGGLDSSIIAAVCAKELSLKSQALPAFSLDYVNNDKYFVSGKFQPDSDNKYIIEMLEYLKCDLQWTRLKTDDLIEEIEEATLARDLPGMADVDFSLLAFCREIRNKVTVALSGECADEIFGGYPWYRDPDVRTTAGFPWAQNTKERAMLLNPEYDAVICSVDFINDRYQKTISECDILPNASPTERRMKEMVNLNQRWFMQTLLDRKDRMSMYCGLEVRVPFCDYRIAEYMYAVPWPYKDFNGTEKGLLRYAMKDLLPDSILYRKKSPYPKTCDPQYSDAVQQLLDAVFSRADEPIWQIVNRKSLLTLIQEESPWPWYGQLMKTPQLMAYMLQINFWMHAYGVSII